MFLIEEKCVVKMSHRGVMLNYVDLGQVICGIGIAISIAWYRMLIEIERNR